MTSKLTLYTIGHSTHSPEKLLKLLEENGVETLIDVRSQPRSRWAPHANPQSLGTLLQGIGAEYLWMGDSLGGRPKDPSCYDPETGKIDYAAVREKDFFRKGLDQLRKEAGGRRACIMCGEEDPVHCHRTLLIGEALREEDVTLVHLRGDGRVQSEEELRASIRGRSSPQLSLPLEEPLSTGSRPQRRRSAWQVT